MPLNKPDQTAVQPGHVASTDRLGLAFPERDYIAYDLLGGWLKTEKD